MFKESCNICCDNYNKSSREKICCGSCDYPACRTCCETYILSETIPKCMNNVCGKEWSRKFIREKFTNVFINTKFKNHLESVLFDQEKALLPATQPILEERIRKETIRKEIRNVDVEIQALYAQRRHLEANIYQTPSTKIASNYVRACAADGCRGFLSTQWKCGICEQWTCPDCHELKGPDRDAEHTCDANNVETAKLLAKDTKPCPKCQSKIFKIDGCDQMWCTQCHTAFSWKTGAIQTSIHNPHYYEWQRKNGGLPRAAGDIEPQVALLECGNELTNRSYTRITDLINSKNHTNLTNENEHIYSWRVQSNSKRFTPNVCMVSDIIQVTIHNMRVELPRYVTHYVERNQHLRVEYLSNEIDEETFKMLVQRNDKKNRKNTEIHQVIQLSITAVSDIVFRMIDDLKNSQPNEHHFDDLLSEFNGIIIYCNEVFKDIAFAYSCIQYKFDNKFNIGRVEKEKKCKKASEDEDDEEN